jgi:hypothetical protein
MSRACARTTGPRIRISRSDRESDRCRASSRPERLSVLSACTQPSTTLSTSNVTFSHAARFACSGRRQRKRGRTRPSRRHREDRRPNRATAPIDVSVPPQYMEDTMHSRRHSSAMLYSPRSPPARCGSCHQLKSAGASPAGCPLRPAGCTLIGLNFCHTGAHGYSPFQSNEPWPR